MAELAEVEKWWRGGRSAREIAAHVHRTKSAVHSLIVRYGWCHESTHSPHREKMVDPETGYEQDPENAAWMHYWSRPKAERRLLQPPPAVAACAEASFHGGKSEPNYVLARLAAHSLGDRYE